MVGAGRQVRIALVGATGYEHFSSAAKVECFLWQELRRAGNLSDYDVLILDLLSLEDPRLIDVEDVKEMLDADTTREVVGNGEGAIYVLGDPRFRLQWDGAEGRIVEPFLSWTGMEFEWDDRGGSALVRDAGGPSGPLGTITANLDRYAYSLASCRPVSDPARGLRGVWDVDLFNGTGRDAICEVDSLCATRYGTSVAFVAFHAIVTSHAPVRQVGRRVYVDENAPEARSGPIVFLPEGRLSEPETIELILREMHGVEISAPEPGWVEGFTAPGQREIDDAIAHTDAEIAAFARRREELLRDREDARRPLGLLYQTGDALEDAVWSALEALGAEVERPEKGTNLADGRATVRLGDEALEFVLEIKGEQRQEFGIKGLRQLADWINDAIDRGEDPPKALMVGNGSRATHPRLRGWPFNHNFVTNARRRGHAAVRSEDLYVAYLLDRRGELDRESFWKKLHETRGPVDTREYRKKLTGAEAEQLQVADAN